MVSKSANYCHPGQGGSNTALLMVCEVALGDMYELTEADDTLRKAPKNYLSVKGLGQTHPDPAETITLDDGVEVPLGKPVPSNVKRSDLLYNEYVLIT
jgi:poly [ADP-ribose] polymerase